MMLSEVRKISLSSDEYPSIKRSKSEGYKTFEEYVRLRGDEPIDLIVGRGNLPKKEYPKLSLKRYVFSTGEEKSYQPFTVDIGHSPDFVASILDVEAMKYFPDNSVDDIYLERLWPPVYMNIRVYIVAIRILKLYGTLVIDFNEAKMEKQKREQQLDNLRGALNYLGISFDVKLISSKEELNFYKRNDIGHDVNSGIVCIKQDDVDSDKIIKDKKMLLKAAHMFGIKYSSDA